MEAILLTVTLLSLAIAVGASVLAWRVMRNDRLRSEARIAALAADLGLDQDERTIQTERRPAPVDPEYVPSATVELKRAGEPIATSSGMFAPTARDHSGFRFAAGIGVAVVIVAAVIGTLVVTSGRTPAAPADVASRAPEPAPADAPLELVALGHERVADGLTVRGVVRGVAPIAEKRPLTAVVLLFDREGTFIASGRADVQPAGADLAGERRFVVSVPSVGNVSRYRVSFRSDEQIVPHLDKRAQPGTLSSEAGTVKSQV
jgi:hypothetical protein